MGHTTVDGTERLLQGLRAGEALCRSARSRDKVSSLLPQSSSLLPQSSSMWHLRSCARMLRS